MYARGFYLRQADQNAIAKVNKTAGKKLQACWQSLESLPISHTINFPKHWQVDKNGGLTLGFSKFDSLQTAFCPQNLTHDLCPLPFSWCSGGSQLLPLPGRQRKCGSTSSLEGAAQLGSHQQWLTVLWILIGLSVGWKMVKFAACCLVKLWHSGPGLFITSQIIYLRSPFCLATFRFEIQTWTNYGEASLDPFQACPVQMYGSVPPSCWISGCDVWASRIQPTLICLIVSNAVGSTLPTTYASKTIWKLTGWGPHHQWKVVIFNASPNLWPILFKDLTNYDMFSGKGAIWKAFGGELRYIYLVALWKISDLAFAKHATKMLMDAQRRDLIWNESAAAVCTTITQLSIDFVKGILRDWSTPRRWLGNHAKNSGGYQPHGSKIKLVDWGKDWFEPCLLSCGWSLEHCLRLDCHVIPMFFSIGRLPADPKLAPWGIRTRNMYEFPICYLVDFWLSAIGC